LPGLRLSVQALARRTALLPEVSLPRGGGGVGGGGGGEEGEGEWPGMFAMATGAAIQGGVLHGVSA
jgi:pantothenate kinase type III